MAGHSHVFRGYVAIKFVLFDIEVYSSIVYAPLDKWTDKLPELKIPRVLHKPIDSDIGTVYNIIIRIRGVIAGV